MKEIKYLAPYFNGGIRGYYDVLAIRTAKKSEIDGQGDIYENDIRIMLDLGDYHHMLDSPKKVPLANYKMPFLLSGTIPGRNGGRRMTIEKNCLIIPNEL